MRRPGQLYDQLRAKLHMSARPRRAKRSPIRRSIAIFVLACLGLAGVVAASAVLLPPRMAADDFATAIPVESTESAIIEEAAPSTTEPRLRATAAPKPKESQKSTETRRVAPPKKKKKVTPPPRVIGTRYACAPLNIRVAAGTKSHVVDRVPARKKIRIMNRKVGKFRMVRFEKKNRWAYEPCLWMKPPPKPKPPVVKKSEPAKPRASSSPPRRKSSAPSVSGGVWDRLAQCESSGDWHYNGGSGFDGGLQFLPSTWTAYGGGKYAKYAYQATREEQIAIAKKVLAAAGWGSWPACAKKLGLL